MEADRVFKALADGTRRDLLDQLRRHGGQTLAELSGHVAMARQSLSQHLDVLEAANLISTVRRGRAKFHYLNTVPLHEIQLRWINNFEQPRLRGLDTLKRHAEETTTMNQIATERPTYVYVTYINAAPDIVWIALTDAAMTASYWGHANVSDWHVGSRWEHRRCDGTNIADVIGVVLESHRPHRLVTTWSEPDNDTVIETVTFDIVPFGEITRLTVTHEELVPDDYAAAAKGWPAVLANLKTFIETGNPLPRNPWEMPA